MLNFEEGFEFYKNNSSDMFASRMADDYVDSINKKIQTLQDNINKNFKGVQTDIAQLKGDVAEFWHGGTFNIDVALRGKGEEAVVERSHGLGSPDIKIGDKEFSSKYYFDAKHTAKAQAMTLKEYYKSKISHDATDEEILKYAKAHGYDDINESIYKNQTRLVPSDQKVDSKIELMNKFEKEKLKRPELSENLKETHDNIDSVVKDNKGNSSKELSKSEAEKLAREAKKGEFDPKKWDLTTEELVKYKHVASQAIKAGLTAATIQMVFKVAPEIYKTIDVLIKNGYIDENDFKKVGFKALDGGKEGFVRGSIAAAITTCCESGLWGTALKQMPPEVVGTLTVLIFNTVKCAYDVNAGNMSVAEMENEVVRELFVTTFAMGGGVGLQMLITAFPLSFMLGSFLGSMAGAFIYQTAYSATMALCVDSGFTMFGLVDQNYTLEDNVLNQIGIKTFEYDKFEYDKIEYDKFEYDKFEYNKFKYDKYEIKFLRRGVIGISKIGYV